MNDDLIQALKLAQAGDWDAAHEIVQSRSDQGAAWIHAYLHRYEGDDGNARYWYRQAGQEFPTADLPKEWQAIFDSLSGE